jgi:nucleotide-binding universal stress UspA family protein
MTIVCATHFSDTSFAAARVAAQLAKTHREPLWLIEILAPTSTSVTGSSSAAPVSAGLAKEAAAAAKLGVAVSTATVFGPLVRAARQFCTEKQAGLMVVGDPDRTLGPLVVGPLDRFADRLSVPVLIVRDSQPFEAWASGSAPLRVMVALDRTWHSTSACEWIAGLAKYGAIDLFASYLWWPKDENERRAWSVTSGQSPNRAESQRLWTDAANAFGSLPANVRRRVRLEAGRPHVGPQLLKLATAEHVDVFVLGTHAHRGPVGQQWSVSHEVLALAPMSVACIPEPQATRPAARRISADAHLFDRAG